MNIKDMDFMQLSSMIQPYLEGYFIGCDLLVPENGVFQERHWLTFDEIEHLIPHEDKSLYDDSDEFYSTCGCLYFNGMSGRFADSDYIVILLSDADVSKALYLYVQEMNNVIRTSQNLLVADFTRAMSVE